MPHVRFRNRPCELQFLCRHVHGIELEDMAGTVKHAEDATLPVVLSIPETAALLRAMSGSPH